jgi:flavin-dependent dehydrogenase
VVVGSGPAGSATALFLARAGFDVALLDRSPFPRAKPCGEYLTPGAVRLLRDEIGVMPELMRQGAARLTRETIVPHRADPFGGLTDALACPRTVTDAVLREAARAAGARVFDGVSIREILRDGTGIRGVSGVDGSGAPVEFRAKVTVGADGSRSLLARTLGVVKPIPRLQRIALVTHYAATGGDTQSVTMRLPRDGTDACCGVGAPCGPDGTRNVNIVVPLSEAPEMAGRRREYFESRLRTAFPEVWDELQGAAMTGPLLSVGCFGHHTTRATGDGAALVGDAATFIHPFTGEGVFFALRGAQMAAETIGRALKLGDTSRHGLRGYDDARRAELLPRYRLCDLVQRVVHSPTLLAWASARLRRSEPLTDLLLRAVGDLARPADLFSLNTLRLAL